MWNIRTRLNKLLYAALPLPLLFVFSSCVKPLKVEDAKINVPNHFKHQQKTTARKPTLKYWEDFRDPTLNQ